VPGVPDASEQVWVRFSLPVGKLRMSGIKPERAYVVRVDPRKSSYDVVVVGGGHNGLVSAAYLARAGLSVLVLARLGQTGGAAVSVEPFAGQPARLSRYSYLVSLMPDALMSELDLDVRFASRTTSSYTPWNRDG